MADDPQKTETGLSRDDVLAIARDEMKRAAGSGDTPNLDAMAQRLADEKIKLAEARTQVAEAQAKLPGEGAVVLTGAEATAYGQLKGRDGFDAAPLAKAAETLDANGTALAEAAALKAQAVQDAAFRKAGLDPEKVRKYLPGLDARIDGEGDAAKVVAVTKTDGGGETTQALDEVMQAEHAAILPALALDGTGAAPAQAGGKTIASRPATTVAKPTSAVSDFIDSVNESRSPAKSASAS